MGIDVHSLIRVIVVVAIKPYLRRPGMLDHGSGWLRGGFCRLGHHLAGICHVRKLRHHSTEIPKKMPPKKRQALQRTHCSWAVKLRGCICPRLQERREAGGLSDAEHLGRCFAELLSIGVTVTGCSVTFFAAGPYHPAEYGAHAEQPQNLHTDCHYSLLSSQFVVRDNIRITSVAACSSDK